MTFSVLGNMVNRPLPSQLGSGSRPASAGGGSFDALVEQFRDLAEKTPIERAQDEVLKRHGISQEQYDAMSPTERVAIDKNIADFVKRTLALQHQEVDAAPRLRADRIAETGSH